MDKRNNIIYKLFDSAKSNGARNIQYYRSLSIFCKIMRYGHCRCLSLAFVFILFLAADNISRAGNPTDPAIPLNSDPPVQLRVVTNENMGAPGQDLIYHPSPGNGIVPPNILATYNGGSGELRPGDWSYLNHKTTFNIVPSVVLEPEEEHPGLFSVQFIVVYNPEKSGFDAVQSANEGWAPGDLFSTPNPAAKYNVVKCPLAGDPQPAGCVASDTETGRILVDIASLGGNVDVENNEKSLIDLNFEILKPGFNPIALTEIDARVLIQDASVSTETIPSESVSGAIRFYPGDFATNEIGFRGTIGFEDLVALGGAYFSQSGDPEYFIKFDIGSEEIDTWFDLPVSDGFINFDDLVIFSTGYFRSADQLLLRQHRGNNTGPINISLGEAVRTGPSVLHYPLLLKGEVRDVRAGSFTFEYDDMEFENHILSEALQNKMVFSASRGIDGRIEWDFGIIGKTDEALYEEGIIGYLRFASEEPGYLRLMESDIRNSYGERIRSVPDHPGDVTEEDIPQEHVLYPNYPNPFNPQTTIPYTLSENTEVRLTVYDLTGRKISVLVDEIQPAGRHEVYFYGESLPSGLYLYRIDAGGRQISRKMLLIK